MVVLSLGAYFIPMNILIMKKNKNAIRNAHFVRLDKLIKMMQAPDNRAASFRGSIKYKSS